MSPRAALIACCAAALLNGCAQPFGSPAPAPTPAPIAAPSSAVPGEPLPPPTFEEAAPTRTVVPEVDDRCTIDADCTVKNVGNCCGYYPACVHKDSPTFPELVAKRCAEEGTASICGYPEIRACACVEGRCTPSDAGSM